MIEIKNLSKEFDGHVIFNNFKMETEEKKIVALIGPNGCGKTTLLHMLAGIEQPTGGRIEINNSLSFVFQHPGESVLPWKTVVENVLLDKNIQPKKVKQMLKEVGLWKFRNNYPYQLSGGMKQLLAIVRAFIHEKEIILLDEPFSSLDIFMTKKIREKLVDLWEQSKPTIIFISHNIDDALIVADEILILGSKPVKIKKTVQIKEKRPRELNNLQKYKNEILKLMDKATD